MFSLIITIIAIVLVLALALATIFYGKTAYTEARVRAQAATLVNQAVQMDGALLLFRQDHGRWPNDINELLSGKYLNSVPVSPPTAALSPTMYPLEAILPTAYAEDGTPWEQVIPNAPQYWVLRAVSEPVCRSINQKVRGDDGIYNAAIPGLKIQCFGQNSDYTVLLHYAVADATPITETVPQNGGVPTLIVNPGGAGWAVEPSTPVTGAPGGTGGTGGNTGDSTETPITTTPTVTSLTPASGPDTGGTTVTVVGTNFQNGAQVSVGGKQVSANVTSPTQLSFVTPAGTAGVSPVTVTSGGKTSASSDFTYTASAAITSITPAFGPMAGGTAVTLTGSNFQSSSKVSINGTEVPTTFVNITRLTFTTPPGAEGSVNVTVKTGTQTTAPVSFQYVAPVGGRITTLGSSLIPNNLANVVADDEGFYAFSGKNFYRMTYGGVSTVLKSSGWGAPCTDSNIQSVAATFTGTNEITVMGNCGSPSGTGFVARVTTAGQVVPGSMRSDSTGIHSALTMGPGGYFYYNTRDGSYTRVIRQIAPDGTYRGINPSGGPDTTGMAADPTAPYVYFVTPYTPSTMVLYRCSTSQSPNSCTMTEIGLLDYPAGTTGVAISAKPYLAFDSSGQLYAATPNAIYKMDKLTGASTPYAGKPGTPGYVDGIGEKARLNIKSIGRGVNGKIYIHDAGAGPTTQAIRRLD